MASVALKEIASVRTFFRARNGVGNSSQDLSLQKSFADTLIGIINGAKSFGPGEGGQLMDALKDKPYGEVQTRRLFDYIDTKMQSGGRSSTTRPSSTNKQLMKCWWNYHTDKDVAVLDDSKASWNSKMTLLVERGLSVGCMDPDEQAFKWALAMLLLMHYKGNLPPYQQIYNKLQDLKRCYAAERKTFTHEQLASFPDDPDELPDYIFSEAYADGKPIKQGA